MTEKNIRVLHLIQGMTLGGGARVMISCSKRTQNYGNYEHRVVSLRPPDPKGVELAVKEGLTVVESQDPAIIFQEIEQADIVHFQWWNCPELLHFVRRPLPKARMVGWLHVSGDHDPQYVSTELIDYLDIAVATSPGCYECPSIQALPSDKRLQKAHMIYACADSDRLKDCTLRAHTGFNVGYIGTVHFIKMHPNFVPMSAKANVPDIRFVICGSGVEQQLQQQAQDLGAAERFLFKGFVEDIKSEIELFDVYGYPLCEGTYASSELNLQEVMSCGVPPVVFPYGGVKRLVVNDYTGLIVHSENEYAQALEYLFHHPEERRRLGENAREYARQMFDPDKAARKFHQLYQAMMKTPKRDRVWGVRQDAPVLHQPVSLSDISDPESSTSGAELLLETLREPPIHQLFHTSMFGEDLDEILAVEKTIMNLPHLITTGGVELFRKHFQDDPFLLLWNGLAELGNENYEAAINDLVLAIQLGANRPIVLWYVALAANGLGLKEPCLQTLEQLLAVLPNFAPAKRLLRELTSKPTESSSAQEQNGQTQNGSSALISTNGYPLLEQNGNGDYWKERNAPKISIVIASLNQATQLRATIRSLSGQHYPNLELIVIDGGSSDRTLEVIHEYQASLTHWESKRDDGQYHALNDGFERASGQIMGWLNAGDLHYPGSLTVLARIFMAYPHIQWLSGRPSGLSSASDCCWALRGLPRYSREQFLGEQTSLDPWIQPESVFWARDLWDRCGKKFDPNYKRAADLDLWARFFRHSQLYVCNTLLAGTTRAFSELAEPSEEYRDEARQIMLRERELYERGMFNEMMPAPSSILSFDPKENEQRG